MSRPANFIHSGHPEQRLLKRALCLFFLLLSTSFSYAGAIDSLKGLLDKSANDRDKANYAFELGDVYADQSDPDNALKYRLQSISMLKKLLAEQQTADTTKLAAVYIRIAVSYANMGMPEKMLEYLADARPYANNNKENLALYYQYTADAYRIFAQAGYPEKLPFALKYYDSLTRFCTNGYTDGWSGRIALDLGLTVYYLSINDRKGALKYVTAAQKLVPQWGGEVMKTQVDYITGSVYMADSSFEQAVHYLETAALHAKSWDLPLYVELQRNMAQCYSALKQWEKACLHYDIFAPLRDSLYTQAADRSYAETEAKYQNKDKQQQIALKNLQIQQSRQQKIWLIVGLVLISSVAVLLLLIYRHKKRTADVLDNKNKQLARLNNDLEEANQTKAKLFGIISHDLRSPISQVYQYLKLQQMNASLLNEQQKEQLTHKIQTATGSLLETMEDLLLWSKTQMNQFSVQMQPVGLHEAVASCLQLLQLNIEAKHLSIENNIPDFIQVRSDESFLQTIVRNLLQNAIKASPDGASVVLHAERSELTIRNSGGHFSQQQYLDAIAAGMAGKTVSGLGLKLVAELSGKADINICFEETLPDTTLVRLTFPG